MQQFVIHEHIADRAGWHHDLRLEMDGTLWSWAVPKGVPETTGVRRLAIRVEDHPIEYAEFEGVIEEGYGKGTVEIYDAGEMVLETDPTARQILFQLRGDKCRGNYVLRHWEDKKWLIWKRA